MAGFYLALAALGTVLPYSAFLPWLAEHGPAPGLAIAELFSTRIGAFFGWDVLVSGVVLVAYIVVESRRLRLRRAWLAIAGTLLVGVSLGLPLFLWQRERALAAAADLTPQPS